MRTGISGAPAREYPAVAGFDCRRQGGRFAIEGLRCHLGLKLASPIDLLERDLDSEWQRRRKLGVDAPADALSCAGELRRQCSRSRVLALRHRCQLEPRAVKRSTDARWRFGRRPPFVELAKAALQLPERQGQLSSSTARNLDGVAESFAGALET